MPPPARRFALRVLAFFTPLLILVGLMEAAFWRTGETVPITQIVAWQTEHWPQGSPRLWQRAVLEENHDLYKKEMFKQRRPRIVALGSSRVLKFRDAMLGRDGKDFLNCGRMVVDIDTLEAFVDSLEPNTTPNVVFLGVDHLWLNSNYRRKEIGLPEDATYDWRAHLTLWRSLSTPSFRNGFRSRLRRALKTPRLDAQGRETLGINARLTSIGFRPDGSKPSDKTQPATPAEWKIDERKWLEKVRQGTDNNVFTTGISQSLLQRLRVAVKKMQDKKVLVLIFAPPQISRAVALYETMPQQRGFWREHITALTALCREFNIPYCDASTPQKLGLTDAAMSDGVHAEETLHLYVLRAWLKDARVRKALPDASRVVEAAIKSPRTGLWFPDLSAAWSTQPGGQSNALPPKT